MDAAWLRQMSLNNAQSALAQHNGLIEDNSIDVVSVISKRINGGTQNESPVLTIANTNKIKNRSLAGGWGIVDIISSKDSYMFVCLMERKIYDPMSFQPVIKQQKQVLTLGRERTSKGKWLLVRSDNSFVELEMKYIKDMDSFLFWMNELIHK